MNSTHMVKETEVRPRVTNCDEITVDGNFATKSLRSVWIVGLNDLIFGPGISIETEDVCCAEIGPGKRCPGANDRSII